MLSCHVGVVIPPVSCHVGVVIPPVSVCLWNVPYNKE